MKIKTFFRAISILTLLSLSLGVAQATSMPKNWKPGDTVYNIYPTPKDTAVRFKNKGKSIFVHENHGMNLAGIYIHKPQVDLTLGMQIKNSFTTESKSTPFAKFKVKQDFSFSALPSFKISLVFEHQDKLF